MNLIGVPREVSDSRFSPNNFKDAYQEFKGKLKNAVGKQVLVVENKSRNHGCGGRYSTIEQTSSLGVLTSSPGLIPYQHEKSPLEIKLEELGVWESWNPRKFDFDHSLVLPMKKYVKISDAGHSSQRLELKEEPLVLSPHELMYLGQHVEAENELFRTLKNAPAIFVETGEDVEKYFRFHNNILFGHKVRTLADIEKIMQKNSKEEREKYLDTSYTATLDLLGIEVPEDFRRNYDGKIYRKRTDVIKEIYGLGVSEQFLRGEIQKIKRNCGKQDEVFMTWGQRARLKDVSQKRATLLQEASALGMSDWNEKIELMPGLSVVASQFYKDTQEYHSEQTLERAQRN